MRKPTLADRMMNEVTIYGGLPMRRCDVVTLAAEHLGGIREPFGAHYFAFHGETVDMEPWPLDEARKVMQD
jgi:hypothetical protein